jgi:HK97 family phage major capsid protein
MVRQLRNVDRVRFAKPGWVIDVRTLEALTTSTDGLGRTLDATRLLVLDDADGGFLLGYPFVATTAAREGSTRNPKSRMYFSADWSEAWIGIDQHLVSVDFSTETAFTTDETIVRAVMHHDFVVRTPRLFAFTLPF